MSFNNKINKMKEQNAPKQIEQTQYLNLSEKNEEVIHLSSSELVNEVISINVASVIPSPFQPRFMNTPEVQEEIYQLSESIKLNGLLNPITVRKIGTNFELIGGERRLRAIRDYLKLEKISAIVDYNMRNDKAAILSLIDNAARKDLSDYEYALAIKKTCDEFKYDFTVDFVTQKFTIERNQFYRFNQLINLPTEITKDLRINPNAVSGHIAQEVMVFINKYESKLSHDEVMECLLVFWSKYFKDFQETKKRSAKFVRDAEKVLIEKLQVNDKKQNLSKSLDVIKENNKNNEILNSSDPIRKVELMKNDIKIGVLNIEKSTKGNDVINIRVSLKDKVTPEIELIIQDFFANLENK